MPPQPDIGYRSAAALIGSGQDIVIPADSPGPVEYEGELVAVIGKQARNVPEKDALDCVARLHAGQRRQRAHLAEDRPHAVAREERRHLQADGAEDRLGHRSR